MTLNYNTVAKINERVRDLDKQKSDVNLNKMEERGGKREYTRAPPDGKICRGTPGMAR